MPTADTVYLVSADHRSDKYRMADQRFGFDHAIPEANVGYLGVYPDHATEFWASAHDFGCGKSSMTPEGAIRQLLDDNGCTNIRIVKA